MRNLHRNHANISTAVSYSIMVSSSSGRGMAITTGSGTSTPALPPGSVRSPRRSARSDESGTGSACPDARAPCASSPRVLSCGARDVARDGPCHSSFRRCGYDFWVEREETPPVVFHADHDPLALLRLSHQLPGERADPGVRQPVGGA